MDPLRASLRKTYIKLRGALSPDYQKKMSQKVCQTIENLEAYRHAKHLALYFAINGEVDLSSLWAKALDQGRFCYFPILMAEKKLAFLPATPQTSLKNNRYGIAEPQGEPSQAIALKDLDLILMPLVAFDARGTRIGMGGGYYDRSLADEKHLKRIGVAYEFQHHPYIKPEAWDLALDMIVTEKNIYQPKIKKSD